MDDPRPRLRVELHRQGGSLVARKAFMNGQPLHATELGVEMPANLPTLVRATWRAHDVELVVVEDEAK